MVGMAMCVEFQSSVTTTITTATPASVTHQHDTSRNRIKRSGLKSCPWGSYTGNPGAGTETLSCLHEFSTGALERKLQLMDPMPVGDVVLTVALMTGAFLGEVALFAILGIF
ncbi:hypothetical protein ACVWWO_000338 [Bradyrhizobium sp. F1.13.1]